MQIVLTKYWVLAHVLILAGIQLLVPFAAGKLNALAWAVSAAFIMALLLPPVREGESFFQARSRTLSAFLKDAFFIQIILSLVFLLIQYLNSGRTLEFQADVLKWAYTLPAVRWLPSSVATPQGQSLFFAFFAAFSLTAIQRVALIRKTRVFLLTGLNLAGACLALTTLLRACFLAPGAALVPLGFATAAGGAAFHLLLLCTSVGCLAEFFLERKPLLYRLALGSLGFNLVGALFSPSIIVSGAALLITVLSLLLLFFLIRHAQNGPILVPAILLIVAVFLPVVTAFFLLPQSALLRTVFLPAEWSAAFSLFCDEWLMKTDLAGKVWSEHIFFGVGNGGYPFFARLQLATASTADWRLFNAGDASAYNDFMQFLCENGVVGMLLLLLPVLMLIFSCLTKWVAVREVKGKGCSYRYLFLLLGSLAGLASVFILSLIGTPLHEGGVLFASIVVLGCLPSWMPSVKR